jgi:hypothetical protein
VIFFLFRFAVARARRENKDAPNLGHPIQEGISLQKAVTIDLPNGFGWDPISVQSGERLSGLDLFAPVIEVFDFDHLQVVMRNVGDGIVGFGSELVGEWIVGGHGALLAE